MRKNHDTFDASCRIGLPITLIDDDEYGGLFPEGVAELWKGHDFPPPENELRRALEVSRQALQSEASKVLGIPNVVKVKPELLIQTRNSRLPRLAQSILHFAGRDWKTQEVVTILH